MVRVLVCPASGEPGLERGGRAEEHGQVHVVVRTRAAPVDQPRPPEPFGLPGRDAVPIGVAFATAASASRR